MSPFEALLYSFLFGLLHGVLPDEHTWPITFSYAIGGASGKEGMRAGLFFSAAFTLQRMVIAELAYLALAPVLRSAAINGIVYLVVGVVMSAAGWIVLGRNRYVHFHLLGHHHTQTDVMERTSQVLSRHHAQEARQSAAPPVRWTLVHGFIAGFGFGGFSLFINTVAVSAMQSPWLGFLPGLLFGTGTTIMLVAIGWLFGASLRWSRSLNESEIQRIGAQTGGRTLFFGGLLFGIFGIATLLGADRFLPIGAGTLLIGLFMFTIAMPAFVYSLREVLASRQPKTPEQVHCHG
jgi:sulfite exporter TauE/SafE